MDDENLIYLMHNIAKNLDTPFFTVSDYASMMALDWDTTWEIAAGLGVDIDEPILSGRELARLMLEMNRAAMERDGAFMLQAAHAALHIDVVAPEIGKWKIRQKAGAYVVTYKNDSAGIQRVQIGIPLGSALLVALYLETALRFVMMDEIGGNGFASYISGNGRYYSSIPDGKLSTITEAFLEMTRDVKFADAERTDQYLQTNERRYFRAVPRLRKGSQSRDARYLAKHKRLGTLTFGADVSAARWGLYSSKDDLPPIREPALLTQSERKDEIALWVGQLQEVEWRYTGRLLATAKNRDTKAA